VSVLVRLTPLRSPVQQLAMIGHELQHAVEVAGFFPYGQQVPGQGRMLAPARFFGVDGPRW